MEVMMLRCTFSYDLSSLVELVVYLWCVVRLAKKSYSELGNRGPVMSHDIIPHAHASLLYLLKVIPVIWNDCHGDTVVITSKIQRHPLF
jgi:hypothetical protein